MTNHKNRSASRAKFTLSGNYIALEYDDANTGERVKREFFIGWRGGYVREAARNNAQVCQGLVSTGNTLMASDPEDLLRIIRKEYGAMRQAQRAEDQRYR